jgi:hypothetical protein
VAPSSALVVEDAFSRAGANADNSVNACDNESRNNDGLSTAASSILIPQSRLPKYDINVTLNATPPKGPTG